MALIKCLECGKEISDKATNCIHCGCPINDTKKKNEYEENNNVLIDELENDEFIIDKTIIDYKRIKKAKKILLIIGIIILLMCVLPILPYCIKTVGGYTLHGTYYPKKTIYDFTPLIYSLLISFIPLIIITLLFISLNYYKKNNLKLTNKRIIGSLYQIGSEVHIDVPIEKINAITSTKSFGSIYGISISSAFHSTYHISYITNSEEFRKKTIKLINENKK